MVVGSEIVLVEFVLLVGTGQIEVLFVQFVCGLLQDTLVVGQEFETVEGLAVLGL